MSVEIVLAKTYLGNISDCDELARRVAQAEADGSCLKVTVEQGDRAKGRILTQTDAGQKVGITKGRDWLLRDGDVLVGEGDRMVLVSVEPQALIALTFSPGANNNPAALVQLGHILGNRHWPVAIKNETLYIELTANAALVKSTIQEAAARLNVQGLQIESVSRTAQNALDFQSEKTHHH